MKLTKKHWMIIGVVAILIIVWYFFLRKKKAESGYVKTTNTKPTCRTGTCPGQHSDGSWWCSSAFCKSAESGYTKSLYERGLLAEQSYHVGAAKPCKTRCWDPWAKCMPASYCQNK